MADIQGAYGTSALNLNVHPMSTGGASYGMARYGGGQGAVADRPDSREGAGAGGLNRTQSSGAVSSGSGKKSALKSSNSNLTGGRLTENQDLPVDIHGAVSVDLLASKSDQTRVLERNPEELTHHKSLIWKQKFEFLDQLVETEE